MKKVIAITGPSGAGKTTLSNYLKNKYKFSFPVHTTTRERRADDEINFYRYISIPEFKSKIENKEFLFYSGYKERYYGILKQDFYDALENSEGLIININYMDLDQIKKIKKQENMVIIQLTFKNIAQMIKDRTKDRNQKVEDTNFRIEVAIRNEEKYQKQIRQTVDIICFTDETSFDNEVKYIEKELNKYYDSKGN